MRAWLIGLLASALSLTALTACSSGGQATDPLVVKTEAGRVKGFTDDGIRMWRGIPFAKPPVDELRWEPPQPVEAWEGTREATQYPQACSQAQKPPEGQDTRSLLATSSEDCLYLNVNSPGRGDGYPVMVWIHGGGFVAGSGNHTSAPMVKRGVVLVSINYRLGRFGFFAHPALDGDVANFGFLDQIAALKWVRDNIEGFGGDPDNVTIFGQSAGGASVNALMTSPRAKGLFDKAIVQSGLGREPALPMREVASRTARAFPASSAAELRELDASDLLAPDLDIFAGEVPVVDEVMPRRVLDAFEAGESADVPYLVGTTDLEFPDAWFHAFGRSPEALREGLLADDGDELLAAYGSQEEIDLHALSDATFTEPARALADAHSDRAPTYRYLFSATTPQLKRQVGGAAHTAETPFVFDLAQGREFEELADQVCDYWVSFAYDGDPDHPDAPRWPEADDGGLMLLRNEGPTPVQDDPWESRLDVVRAANERVGGGLPRISP